MIPLLVRCQDKTVFEVCRDTLGAKSCSYYDAYCFSDPRKDVEYISYSECTLMRNEQWYRMMKEYYES